MRPMKKMLAVALLGTLPLMAGMCGGGQEAPQPEAAAQAPPKTTCRDSVKLALQEVFALSKGFQCSIRGGIEEWGAGPLGISHNYIINSSEEFRARASCSCWNQPTKAARDSSLASEFAKIDFATQTVLVGEMVTVVYGHVRDSTFSHMCDDHYSLSLNLMPLGSATVVSTSPYLVVVPKLPQDAKVKFNIYSKRFW